MPFLTLLKNPPDWLAVLICLGAGCLGVGAFHVLIIIKHIIL